MTKLIENRSSGSWAQGIGFIVIAALLLVALTQTAKPSTRVGPTFVTKEVEKTVDDPVLTAYDKRQIQCLAVNTYFEAGNQPTKGKIAVNNVVMNRVNDKRFPSSPCGVIYQKSRRVCQFSWVCEGKKRIRDWKMFHESRRVAELVYLENVGDVTKGAKFYHADYVNPRWRLERIMKIGDHIFYRG